MEKEESPTDATVELDGDDMEGSGEDGDLEGSDSEAAQWADQEQWFGMQWPRPLKDAQSVPPSKHTAACGKLSAIRVVKQDKVASDTISPSSDDLISHFTVELIEARFLVYTAVQ